ncbi:Ig-like domain repeat protein [Streptomyces sp. NPDC051940]|uniref:WD40 repeat domain-containing protein n=1 Tax=Streptomyces sp. NPDC051940 TaxID=3155675 RepID=UPI00341A2CCE
MKSRYRLRRTVSAAAALVLGGAGLTLAAAPAAHAATDEVVKLPIGTFSAMAVDSAHRKVFIADSTQYDTPGTVVVYDFDGQRLATLAGASAVNSLALGDDGTTLYVAEARRIVRYDTETLAELGTTATSEGVCGGSMAASGGRVWHTMAYNYGCAADAVFRLNGVSADGSAYTTTGWSDTGLLRLAGGPAGSGRLYLGQSPSYGIDDPYVTVFDTSGETVVRGPVRRFASPTSYRLDLQDLAASPDGRYVAAADWTSRTTRLMNAADLSDAATGYQPFPGESYGTAVAFSPDGRFVARGAYGVGSSPDLLVQGADPESSQEAIQFAFAGALDGDWVVPGGLSWSADGTRLFAVTRGNGQYLHILQPPAAQYDSRFAAPLTTSPGQPVAYEPLALRGRLELDGPAPVDPAKVRAVRTDASGTHELAAATVAADGTFTVLDQPVLVGEATYTVSYLGDLTHRPAADASLTVQVGKAPTAVALTAPATGTLDGGVEITGKLTAQGKSLPAGVTLRVERADRLGTGTLSSVAVAADGTFRINDLPRTRGDVTYTVTYPGDDLHEASTAAATVYVSRH